MYNPFDTLRRFQSRLGKPIRPIVEFQKNGSVISIITNTIQTENMIQDPYRNEAWELHPEDRASAIYVDGVFKGMGFVAGEEGQILKPDLSCIDEKEQIEESDLLWEEVGSILQVKKDIELYNEVLDAEGNPILVDVLDPKGNPTGRKVTKRVQVLTASYKGLMSKLLDASIMERGSALKPSMMQTLIYCALVGFAAFMAGMSYG